MRLATCHFACCEPRGVADVSVAADALSVRFSVMAAAPKPRALSVRFSGMAAAGKPFLIWQLHPNLALKECIDEYLEAHPWAFESAF